MNEELITEVKKIVLYQELMTHPIFKKEPEMIEAISEMVIQLGYLKRDTNVPSLSCSWQKEGGKEAEKREKIDKVVREHEKALEEQLKQKRKEVPLANEETRRIKLNEGKEAERRL